MRRVHRAIVFGMQRMWCLWRMRCERLFGRLRCGCVRRFGVRSGLCSGLRSCGLRGSCLRSGSLRPGSVRSGGLRSGGMRSGGLRCCGLRSFSLRRGGLQSQPLRRSILRTGCLTVRVLVWPGGTLLLVEPRPHFSEA